jgi:hypothetical protein
MSEKGRRLEAANFERAEAAVRWEAAENRADESGSTTDRIAANEQDRLLVVADRKIKVLESPR